MGGVEQRSRGPDEQCRACLLRLVESTGYESCASCWWAGPHAEKTSVTMVGAAQPAHGIAQRSCSSQPPPPNPSPAQQAAARSRRACGTWAWAHRRRCTPRCQTRQRAGSGRRSLRGRPPPRRCCTAPPQPAGPAHRRSPGWSCPTRWAAQPQHSRARTPPPPPCVDRGGKQGSAPEAPTCGGRCSSATFRARSAH
jgi:hypothetical protein